MKGIATLLILLLLFPFHEKLNDELNEKLNEKLNDESNKKLNEQYDSDDAAHFKYYENESHIIHWYEWWYANVKGEHNSILVFFFTFGNLNNPFLSLVGATTFFFTENGTVESITAYPFIHYNLDYEKCNVSIAGNRFYEENGKFFIKYNKKDFSVSVEMEAKGKAFGREATPIKEWQWAAWHVAVPYGIGKAGIIYKGNEYVIEGKAYHDHNWGMAKMGFFEWDWGEFGIEKLDNEFAIIYGIVKGEDKMKGGIHFVNDSMHVFIPYGKANIEYLEWGRINGFKKPTKLHIYGESVYGENRNISVDMIVEMEKYYIIGIRDFGKPYLVGKATGKVSIGNRSYSFSNVKGFYEHHGLP
ncbi:hypothetical protein B6U81_06525 [Thermoplasmatales archaeon ex4484_30]|nr:MAG: hypothetical protein B6U81_06525 [Thermoplasmatales archaeon ex4484_30]